MLTPAYRTAISNWNRDELRRAVNVLYDEKGFAVEETQNLPEPIAFLSKANAESTDLIAVGCLAAGDGAAPTTQIQLFWQRMQERQIQSGVMVTNGRYEAAAIEFAAPFSLLLIDIDSLSAAIGDLPEPKQASLFPATNTVAQAAPPAVVSEKTQAIPFTASPHSGLLGAPAGHKQENSKRDAEKGTGPKPYPLPAAAIQPAWRPMTSTTKTLVEVAHIEATSKLASMVEMAMYLATEPKPGQLSVIGRSLSTVLGTCTAVMG